MEFSRQESWSGLPFSFPGDIPEPGIEPGSPALRADALPSEPPTNHKLKRICLFHPPPHLRKTTTTKNPLTAQDPSKGIPSTPASFLDLPLRIPRPRLLPVTRSRKHPLHPTKKLLFKDFLPSPAKPGALAIRRGNRCSLFSKKKTKLPFPGKKKKELDEAFWGSKTRAGRGGGEESPARPIASPALSPPLRLGPVPPPQPLRLGPAPPPLPRSLGPAPPPQPLRLGPVPPPQPLRLGPAPPPQPRRLGLPLHLSPRPAPRLGPAPQPPPRQDASAPPSPTSWAGTRRPLRARFPRPIWCLGGGGGRGGVRGGRGRGRGRGAGSQPCRSRSVRTREASASRLGTMGLGARGFLTLLALGVVLGVALLKVFTDSADPEGTADNDPKSPENSKDSQGGSSSQNNPQSERNSNGNNEGGSPNQNNPQSGGNSNGNKQEGLIFTPYSFGINGLWFQQEEEIGRQRSSNQNNDQSKEKSDGHQGGSPNQNNGQSEEKPGGQKEGSPNQNNGQSEEKPGGQKEDPQGHPSHRHEPSNVSAKPSTASVSPVSKNVTTTTLKDIGKSSSETKDSPASNHGTATTSTPFATSKMITPVVSTNMTSTTLRSTPKITNVSQNTSQVSVSTVPTAHNSSSSVTVTTTIISKENKGSKFDTGSFVGGIVLTLGVLSFLYIGCKVYYSRRGIRYRTIDEHDAII
uniref:Porimin n=1 Tax=Bos mutus grunniens TaxID=30521 RepID=A0A8C0AEA9_BOSMU